MAYDKTRTEPTKSVGDLNLRTFTLDISNYDDDTNGDGESFTPDDAQMHRFVHTWADVIDGTGMVAQYDEDAQAVRLFQQEDDGGGTTNDPLTEVPSDSNEGAKVRVTALGV